MNQSSKSITESADPRFIQGIEYFNCRQFFRCHEIWESLWRDQVAPEKTFTQGLIQIAVAYHHLLNGNTTGAGRLFNKGLAKLADFLPVYANIDVIALTMAAAQINDQIKNDVGAIRATASLTTPQIKIIKQA